MPKYKITITGTFDCILDTADFDSDYIEDISTDGEIDKSKFANCISEDIDNGDFDPLNENFTHSSVLVEPVNEPADQSTTGETE